MKILTVDIETAPNLAYVWGLWNENISIQQLREAGRVLSVCYKFRGESSTQFCIPDDKNAAPGPSIPGMVACTLDELYSAWSSAEAIVTWNGDRFDIPHVQRLFLENGYGPPSPSASIDLLKTVRKQFKFPSNKLDYVAGRLLGQNKLKHPGFELWKRCMDGDPKAWELMLRYNRKDVILTEKLYDKLLPWISNHPSVPLRESQVSGCPACASRRYECRGYAYTSVSAYRRYRCLSCGRWYRGSQRVHGVEGR